MYRPTARMSDVYQKYVDGVAEATKLDKTQVIRLALFTAPFSEAFKEVLRDYERPGVQVPLPTWELYEDQYFLEKDPQPAVGEGVGVQHEDENKNVLTENKIKVPAVPSDNRKEILPATASVPTGEVRKPVSKEVPQAVKLPGGGIKIQIG